MTDPQLQQIDTQIAEEVQRTNLSRRLFRLGGVLLTFIFGALATFAAAKISSDGIGTSTIIAVVTSVITVLLTNFLFLKTKFLRTERNRLEMLDKIWNEERRSRLEQLEQANRLVMLQAELEKSKVDAEVQELLAQRLELIEKFQELRLLNLETVFRDHETEGETVER